jgi:hypothetical protein
VNTAFIRRSSALRDAQANWSGVNEQEVRMKTITTALVAAGALFALSGCVADPYYGNSYYGGGGYYGGYGGSAYGYYGSGRPSYGYNNYGRNYGGYYNQPYRGNYGYGGGYYDRRYRRY